MIKLRKSSNLLPTVSETLFLFPGTDSFSQPWEASEATGTQKSACLEVHCQQMAEQDYKARVSLYGQPSSHSAVVNREGERLNRTVPQYPPCLQEVPPGLPLRKSGLWRDHEDGSLFSIPHWSWAIKDGMREKIPKLAQAGNTNTHPIRTHKSS